MCASEAAQSKLRGRCYLAEIHALHSFATKRRTDRWRRRRLPRTDYELDNLVFGESFLGHIAEVGLLRRTTVDDKPRSCGEFGEEQRTDAIAQRRLLRAMPPKVRVEFRSNVIMATTDHPQMFQSVLRNLLSSKHNCHPRQLT